MDVQVPNAITMALRLRDVDVLTAQEDGSRELEDADLLDRAGSLGRIMFSQDDDMLREGALRQMRGEPFRGIIYAHQLNVTIGQCVTDLELIAKASDSDERCADGPLQVVSGLEPSVGAHNRLSRG